MYVGWRRKYLFSSEEAELEDVNASIFIVVVGIDLESADMEDFLTLSSLVVGYLLVFEEDGEDKRAEVVVGTSCAVNNEEGI